MGVWALAAATRSTKKVQNNQRNRNLGEVETFDPVPKPPEYLTPCREGRPEANTLKLLVFLFSGQLPNSAKSCFAQDTGNKVARKALLVGTQNIILGGKTVIQPEVMIRGDLIRSIPSSSSSGSSGAAPNNTAVSIGRYCFLSRGCCLRPPGRLYKGYVSLPGPNGSHRRANAVLPVCV